MYPPNILYAITSSYKTDDMSITMLLFLLQLPSLTAICDKPVKK